MSGNGAAQVVDIRHNVWQHRRTGNGLPPPVLPSPEAPQPGEFFVEYNAPRRIWFGVKPEVDPTGRLLIYEQDYNWDADAPADGAAYGRLGNHWAKVLPLAGGQMTGALHLYASPLADDEAANKAYVDQQITLVRTYLGIWVVASNTPALGSQVPLNNGDYFFAETATPGVEMTVPVGVPDIAGQQINSGDIVIYNGTNWEILRSAGITQADADARYVRTAGSGTTPMTGLLLLSGPAQSANNPVTYQQMSDAISTLQGGISIQAYLQTSGGTMTGPLVLAGYADTAANGGMQAVPYAQLESIVSQLEMAAFPEPANDTFAYVRSFQVWQRGVRLAGDTMTGFLTLSGDPTSPLHAVTKQYADQAGAYVGDSPPANPTNGKFWWDTTDGQLNIFFVGQSASQWVTAFNAMSIAALPLAGGTMTGPMTLWGDPVTALQPATMQYAQSIKNTVPQLLTFTIVGAYTASETINVVVPVAMQIPGQFAGSTAYRPGNNTTARAFTISQVRGSTVTQIGTINVSTGTAGTATFAQQTGTAAMALQAGDVLRLTAPTTADSTLNNFAATILAYTI